MTPVDKSRDALRRFLEEEFKDARRRFALSKLIAKYVAESIREDRKRRSLFTMVFGD